MWNMFLLILLTYILLSYLTLIYYFLYHISLFFFYVAFDYSISITLGTKTQQQGNVTKKGVLKAKKIGANVNRCQSEPAIQAMQFLDVITMKDPAQKSHFYRSALIEAMPFIPKVTRNILIYL